MTSPYRTVELEGRPGIQGPKGDRGDKGDRGPMGLEGPMGPEGPPGPRGEQGVQGFEGRRGPRGIMGFEGKPGKDGAKGDKGDPGKDGTANMDEVKAIAELIAKDERREHEEQFDHDPFLLGTKKVSEAGMLDGMILTFDAKANRLFYAKPKAQASKTTTGGRGLSLPSQSGNSGKFLTTDGERASWDTPAGGGGVSRSISSVSTDTTAGAVASTDYVYFCSGTMTLTMPTAVGNTNRYSIKNTGSDTVTVAFNGAQTGDGSATLTLLPNVSVDLVSNNSNFFIL